VRKRGLTERRGSVRRKLRERDIRERRGSVRRKLQERDGLNCTNPHYYLFLI